MESDNGGGFSTAGMPITFKNLSYSVPSNKEKGKEIFLLHELSGFFKPSQMSALMGPSGSGKTTLLDVLAGRKTQGTITGEIAFANYPPSKMFLRRYTGYVEQFDTLLSILTVKEMLMYTAELKAKRVNIGIALISDPRVLFLDEPTSGLDSYTSNEVMSVVKGLVADGTTICATIHSPTPSTFALFDSVILLLRGHLVYFGAREQAVGYFEALSAQSSSNAYNEAEWLTDIVVKADRDDRAVEFGESFKSSPLKQSMDTELSQLSAEKIKASKETMEQLQVKRATVTPFWWALLVFMKYRSTRNFRSPEFLGPRIGDKLIFSLLIGTVYWDVGKDFGLDNYFNISSLLFMWCTLPGFGAASYVPSIVLERVLFYRERNDGLYRVITYIVAKMIDELVIALVASVVFGLIVYLLANLECSFFIFWIVYFGTLANGIVLAYLIGALSPNMDVANAAVPAYVVTLLFFMGQLIRLSDIPNYWFWYSKINFLKYSFGALMVSQFADRNGEPSVMVPDGEGSFRPILDYYSLYESEAFYVGWLFVFFVGFFVATFLAMTYIKHQRR